MGKFLAMAAKALVKYGPSIVEAILAAKHQHEAEKAKSE